MNYFVAPNAIIEKDVAIGEGSKVWYFSHIREKAKIGRNCSIGSHCTIGCKVIIGDDVRIGDHTAIYEGAIIKDRVYIGPEVTFTNVRKPKATKKGKKLDTIIEEDVSIGANATIVAGVKIGKGACIAEGAIVYYDVPENVLVASPAAQRKKKIISL